MKIYLLFSFVFLFAYQIATPAQPKEKQNAFYCNGFSTPIIKPEKNEDSLLVGRPDKETDYKMIIINPCIKAVKSPLLKFEGFKFVSPLMDEKVNSKTEVGKINATSVSPPNYLTLVKQLPLNFLLLLNQKPNVL